MTQHRTGYPGLSLFQQALTAAIEPPCTGPGWYRVQGDWEGGGFGYTLHFASAADAWAWGRAKARFHRRTEITVTLRESDVEPGELTEAEVDRIAADLAYNRAKSDGTLDRQRVERAMDLERFNPAQGFWK
jgi:hypothetical protein